MNRLQKNHKEKHEFALHVPFLTALVEQSFPGDAIAIADEAMVHRMKNVLRLGEKDTCVFFDKNLHVLVIIGEYSGKKRVQCTLVKKEINRLLSPSIVFLLPVLKKDDFEAALYSLTEIGVSTIQLIITQKTHGISSFNQKDMERAQRVVIAAAEQSKNFAYPELKPPVMLLTVLNSDLSETRIFFDQNGDDLFSCIQNLRISAPKDIVLLIGPEGDLSGEEKDSVQSKKFVVCSLTPTVLRSVQAAALSAGLIRSLLVR